MNTRKIDGESVLWSRPAAVELPLLVLLHGRGSNEADLSGLVPYLPPELVAAAVRGTVSEGPGFSWYPAEAVDVGTLDTEVDRSVRALLQWLDSLPPVRSVGLLGFSQGAAMALQAMRYRPDAFSFIVQLSGFVIDGPQPGDVALADRHMPVFWGRGDQDTVISADRIERTAHWLPAHARVDEQIYQIGHSVGEDELADVSAVIRAHL